MTTYIVRLNGKPIREFTDKADANIFMQFLMQKQQDEALREALIEAALAKSDMSEANEVIQYIMEK